MSQPMGVSVDRFVEPRDAKIQLEQHTPMVTRTSPNVLPMMDWSMSLRYIIDCFQRTRSKFPKENIEELFHFPGRGWENLCTLASTEIGNHFHEKELNILTSGIAPITNDNISYKTFLWTPHTPL